MSLKFLDWVRTSYTNHIISESKCYTCLHEKEQGGLLRFRDACLENRVRDYTPEPSRVSTEFLKKVFLFSGSVAGRFSGSCL